MEVRDDCPVQIRRRLVPTVPAVCGVRVMGEGASSLSIEIGQAYPMPPDIPEAGRVPGGALVPCTPFAPELPTVSRNQWRLDFPFTQGFALTLRRIQVALPVFLLELGLELQKATTKTVTRYKTGKEAEEANEGAGGYVNRSEELQTIGYATRYERIWQTTSSKFVPSLEAEHTSEIHTERSILPVTVQVVARLIGPEGLIWSESYDVPIHYVQGIAPGTAAGSGRIDAYADLNNPIAIDPAKSYGLELLMAIPTSVGTNTQLGIEIVNGSFVQGKGEVVFFYDLQTAPVGK
jgi:hypothetical protein